MLDLTTRKPLSDKIEWVKVSGVAWRGNGFYYSRYPAPEKGKELSSVNENHQVYYHRIGTPQSADELVFGDPKNPQRFHTLQHHRRRALRGSRHLRPRHRQAGQRGVRDGPVEARREVHAADSGHHRRHLQRARERARRAAGLHRQQRAERPRRPHRPGEPGAGELESDPRPEARHHRQRRGGRRQGDRDLHEGCRVEGLRAQPRRRARERDRSAGPRQRQRLRRQHGRQVRSSTTTPRSPIRRRSSATTSRRERARCSARRRFPASTPTSTRPSRCS